VERPFGILRSPKQASKRCDLDKFAKALGLTFSSHNFLGYCFPRFVSISS